MIPLQSQIFNSHNTSFLLIVYLVFCKFFKANLSKLVLKFSQKIAKEFDQQMQLLTLVNLTLIPFPLFILIYETDYFLSVP